MTNDKLKKIKDIEYEFNQLLNSESFLEAKQLIDQSRKNNSLSERNCIHFEARVLMKEGDWSKAINLLEGARNEFGDHIRLLSDLASCYYVTEDVSSWRHTYRLLERNFDKLKFELDSEITSSILLDLGKYNEEDGQLCIAENKYKDSLNLYDEFEDPNGYFLALAQIVRLKTIFKTDNDDIAKNYQKLLQFPIKNVSFDCFIESQHALLLAEASLFSPKFALKRLKDIFNDDRFDEYDRSLCFYDFSERSLLQLNKEEVASLVNELPFPDPQNGFDKIIKSTIENKKNSSKDLRNLAEGISLSCYLRSLKVLLKHFKNIDHKEEFIKKYNLLISSLPSKSREFWLLTNTSQNKDDLHTILIDTKDSNIEYKNQIKNIRKRKVLKSLVELLVENTSPFTLEQITKSIWDEEYSTSHFDRIRMNVKELNKILIDFGVPLKQPIRVTKNELILDNKINFSQK